MVDLFTEVPKHADADFIMRWRPSTKLLFLEYVQRAQLKLTALVKSVHTGEREKVLSRFMHVLNLLIYGSDPFVDLATFISLIISKHPYWASCLVVCVLLPYIVLWLAFNRPFNRELRELRQAAFKRAFGGRPFFLRIIFAELQVLWRELRGNATLEQQCFLQVRLLAEGTFEAFPWTLFQCYIAWRQTTLEDVEVVNPYMLAISLPQSIYTVYMAYSYLSHYSKMTHEGNVGSFLDNLLLLGEGMAPPMLLDKLQNAREVVVKDNLKQLDYRGLMSIGHAVASSPYLEKVSFLSTGIECSLAATHAWGMFVDEMTFNRTCLHSIVFSPAVVAEWPSFSYAQRLQEVLNGEKVTYSFKMPCSELLFQAVEEDNSKAVASAVKESKAMDLSAGAKWAASVGHWRSLAAILAEKPALLVKLPLLRNASSEGHQACTQLLLACGVHPDHHDALYYAANCGQLTGAKQLLGARADPNHPASHPPLHGVSWVDGAGVTKALVRARANPDQLCPEGYSPLWRCAERSAPKAARVLIDARANLEAVDARQNRTPLLVAAEMGSAETLRVLLRARANIDAKTKRGWTAMDIANDRNAGRSEYSSEDHVIKVLRNAVKGSLLQQAAEGSRGLSRQPQLKVMDALRAAADCGQASAPPPQAQKA